MESKTCLYDSEDIMYYTVYKVTNKVNGKYYIGKHQTVLLTDSYMGSGKLLRRAIQKYGSNNFVKEILYVCDNKAEMNAKEKELAIVSKETYNLCEGGKGGFGYINRNKLNGDKFAKVNYLRKTDKQFIEKENARRVQQFKTLYEKTKHMTKEEWKEYTKWDMKRDPKTGRFMSNYK